MYLSASPRIVLSENDILFFSKCLVVTNAKNISIVRVKSLLRLLTYQQLSHHFQYRHSAKGKQRVSIIKKIVSTSRTP